MAHENFRRQDEVKHSSDRGFGLVFAVVFMVLGVGPAMKGLPLRLWALALAVLLLIAALLYPRLLAPLNRVWARIGVLLGHVVSPVALAVLFYLVVVPTGLAMRVLGRAKMRSRFDRQTNSYWLPRRPPGPPPDSMTNQF